MYSNIVSSPVTKRVTAHHCTNQGKTSGINDYFVRTKTAKNILSGLIHDSYLTALWTNDTKKMSQAYKTLNNPSLFAWEAQVMAVSLFDFYLTNLKTKLSKYRAPLIEYVLVKPKRKRDEPFLEKRFRKTELSQLVEVLVVLDFRKSRRSEKESKEVAAYLEKLNDVAKTKLASLDPEIQIRVHNLVALIIKNMLKNLKTIEFKTGSVMKMPQVLKAPLLLKDETNTKYQYFYFLNIPDSENIKVPLAIDQDYHGDFSEFNVKKAGKKRSNSSAKMKESPAPESLLQSQHMISQSARTGRLTIGLLAVKNYEMLEPYKKLGIDVGGGSDNHIATEDFIMTFDHLEKISAKLDILDKHPDKESDEYKRSLARIHRENLSCIHEQVAAFLKAVRSDGYTDIVMEELNQFGRLTRRNKSTGLKLNRYFSLVRMSGLADIFKKIGRNLGIRVHTIPSYYTSKWCRDCNTIDDDNRSGKKFLCVNCGAAGHADKRAGGNMTNIFERFSKVLCKPANKYGEIDANRFLSKEFVRSILAAG